MRTLHLRLKLHRQLLIDGGMFLLLTLTIIIVTILYISHDRNFHWWIDWWSRAVDLADLLRADAWEALRQVQISLAWDRNSLYILPVLPFILLLGESRLVYEVGLALVYLLPFCLVMGAIARQLMPSPNRLAFWLAAFLTVWLPVNWMPTFLGIPDTGGAALIALATLVYLQDLRLKQWWRIPLIGVLLASAILLRRHFSYGAVALLASMSLSTIGLAWAEAGGKLRAVGQECLGFGIRCSLIMMTIFVVMRLVAWEFTYQALTKDYRNLYASWSLPVAEMVDRYIGFYGLATWGLALSGLVLGLVHKTLIQQRLLPFCLMGGISLLIWIAGLRYGNVFYALHITPLIVIGLAACLGTVANILTGQVRWLILSSVVGYLVINCTIAFLPMSSFPPQGRSLFAFQMPPLVRTDSAELVRLVDYLRSVAPAGQSIYVVGHQRLQLTSSLLKAVEQVYYRWDGHRLNFLTAPQIDSQDVYPLEALLQAEYVVIPQPLLAYGGDPSQVPVIGEWVLPSETDVVQVVLDAFAQNQTIAQDFERSPFQFQLDYGTTVSVYHRIRPTSLQTAVRSFHTMRQQIGDRPGGQLNWISLGTVGKITQVSHNPDGTDRLVSFAPERLPTTGISPRSPSVLPWHDPVQDNSAAFLYVGPLAEQTEVKGWLKLWTQPCRGAALKWSVFDLQGTERVSADWVQTRTELTRFTRSLSTRPTDSLVLQVLSQANDHDKMNYCTVDVNQLFVSTHSSKP